MPGSRKRILVCIDWFEPGFKAGGPIRSVANIVSALKDDFEFYVLTSAYDLGETEPYPGIALNQWHDREGIFIKYLDRSALTAGSIRGNILEIEPDILYLNSLFSKLFTIVPISLANRKGIKVVLAPRGMLGQGALEIKRNKKKLFLTLARYSGFYKHVTWHASTHEEQQEIVRVFGKKARIRVAQNIPVAATKKLQEIMDSKNTGNVVFVFISRIATKKNLDMAVKAMKQVYSSQPVFFDIYGHIEDQAYFDSFRDDLKDHGNVHIRYKGVLNPADIADVYMNADFMVLPTKHENYGHAIVEAWANGCPVIISKNTPWKNLRVQDLGWDVNIENFQDLVDAIQEGVNMDLTSYLAMVRASYNYFEQRICDKEIMNANRRLFEE